MLKAIDVILHKPSVYRHLLVNRPFKLGRVHKAAFLLGNGLMELFGGWAQPAVLPNRVILSVLAKSVAGENGGSGSDWVL